MDASADAAKVKYLDHVIPAGILTEANHGVTLIALVRQSVCVVVSQN